MLAALDEKMGRKLRELIYKGLVNLPFLKQISHFLSQPVELNLQAHVCPVMCKLVFDFIG